MGQLVSESEIIGTPRGDVLEITFRGIHESGHGREMNRYIEAKLAETRPVGILFNLLDYEYVFGNDVTGLFTSSFDRSGKKLRIRPICIVATGKTHRSLYESFKSSRLLDALRIEFTSGVEPGLQRLRERLAENSV